MGTAGRTYGEACKQVSLLRAIVQTVAFSLVILLSGTAFLCYLLSYSKADSIQDVKCRFLIGDGLDEFPFRGPVWYHYVHGSLHIRGEADYDEFKAWASGRDPDMQTRTITSDPKDRVLGEPGDEYTGLKVRGKGAILQVQGFRSGRVSIDSWVRPR